MRTKAHTLRDTPIHFRLPSGVDCLVHEEAIRALGLKAAGELKEKHHRLFRAIAAEKAEWMHRFPSMILIGEKDVAAHLYQ